MKMFFPLYILLPFFLHSCSTTTNTKERAQNYEDSIYAEYYKDSCNCEIDEFNYEFLDGENFKALIRTDSTTMNFPFNKLKSIGAINLFESTDGFFRLYVWRDPKVVSRWGGIDYICQYRTESGDIRTNDDLLPVLLSPLSELEGLNKLKLICDLNDNRGNGIYILEVGNRIETLWYYEEISAIRIDGDKLSNCHAFPNKEKSIAIGYSGLSDWFYRTDGQGWDWINSYDSKTKSLYVPVVDEQNDQLIDRYNVYTFDGRSFKMNKTDGGFWLNAKLRSFKELKTFVETKDFIIRVDLLDNESYRYASWKRGKTMLDDPDIIITSTQFDCISESYIFVVNEDENNTYEYYVKDGAALDTSIPLTVKKNGKVLLRQKRNI